MKKLVPIFLALSAAQLSASGLTDDFQAYAPGALAQSEANTWQLEGSSDLVTVVAESGNSFGKEADNQYLKITASGKDALTLSVQGAEVSPAAILTLDFMIPEEGAPEGSGYCIEIGSAPGKENTAFAVVIKDGAVWAAEGSDLTPGEEPLTQVTLGKPYKLMVVANNSDDTITYGIFNDLVSEGCMDVLVKGDLVGAALPKSSGEGGEGIDEGTVLSSFSISAAADSTGTLLIDNVSWAEAPAY